MKQSFAVTCTNYYICEIQPKTMNIKIKLLSLTLIIAMLGIAGCNKDDDNDTDNGVPSNTLIVSGTSIAMSSVVCTNWGSGNDLVLTASDVAQNNILYIRFTPGEPTSVKTYTLTQSGSGAEAWGDYTVNGSIVYEIQSGTATVTPNGSGFIFTFNNVIAEDNNVQVTLSFNGNCN